MLSLDAGLLSVLPSFSAGDSCETRGQMVSVHVTGSPGYGSLFLRAQPGPWTVQITNCWETTKHVPTWGNREAQDEM